MSALSPGGALAGQIAALEAEGAGHERLERGHLLIGVLSLEKFREVPSEEIGVAPGDVAALRQEIGRIDEALRLARAKGSELRRRLREALGMGAASGRRRISRSERCKRAFVRAAELAGGAPSSALHLLAALVVEPDAPLAAVLRESGVDGRALADAAMQLARARAPAPRAAPPAEPVAVRILQTMLATLCDVVRRQHGVELTVTPEAEVFLAQSGFRAEHGARELARVVETLVQAPLSGLVRSGRLARHPAWTVVYDEGGLYLLPS